jgi:hypothetical protein
MSQQLTPDNQLSKDPGDDTQRRFRYQAAYAAVMSLSLLDEDSGVSLIYCEHHEDVLVKRKDNTFIGIQVKTRASGKSPFKANDEEVVNSIKRFVEHEIKFNNSCFSRYNLVANCGFWYDRKDGSNFKYILELAKNDDRQNATLDKFIKNILTLLPLSSQEIIINVLQKTDLVTSPGLDDIESHLLNLLTKIPNLKESKVEYVTDITKRLIDKCLNAASLVHNSPKIGYFPILDNPQDEKLKLIIKEKQITKESILNLIKEITEDVDKSLLLASSSLSQMPKGIKKLIIKMEHGGLSKENIELAGDHKTSAEFQLVLWEKKHGFSKADSHYQHVKTIVRTQCQEAYDVTISDEELFGLKMLNEVRERLKIIHKEDKSSLFNLRYEHLFGICSILTEECKIWWSKKFDIDKEVKS